MTKFSIIGGGWRSEFFLRIARELPDLFEIPGMLVRKPERAEELRRVCRDVLDEARRLGISVPRLEAAAPLF